MNYRGSYRKLLGNAKAIAWKYGLKDNPQYCWRAHEGVLTKYSNEVITFIQRLSAADVEAALTDYRGYLRSRSAAKVKANQ